MRDESIKSLLAIQLKAMASLQLQMSATLTGKGQDELRKHFMESAEIMIKAAEELRS
jgi:uncharacterized membrane-anchored protein YhcB (DUF1043 family)